VEIWMRVRVPVLFVVLVVAAIAAAASAPDAGFVAGLWPIGLAVGLLLLAPRRLAPVLLLAVLVIATASVGCVAQPFDVALGYGVGVTLEVALATLVLAGGPRGGSGGGALRTDADLRRWFTACFGAAGVGAVAMTLTAWMAGAGSPVTTGIGVGLAHLASLLILTPFFLRPPEHGSIARGGERTVQWIAVVVAVPLLFLPAAAPGLIFAMIPLLAWGALRISPYASMAQLLGVVTCAVGLAWAGRGPFPPDPEVFGVPSQLEGALIHGFAIACAVIVVPLMLRVGEYLAAAREADAERYLVSNIVDSATGVAIIVTDEIGRIVRFNPGAERLLGYRAEEVLGEFTPFLHTDDAVADKAGELGVRADYVDVVLGMVDLADGSLFRFRRKDGVERIHNTTITGLVDRRGRATGYLSTSEDVTDAVVVEEALRAALAAEQEAVEKLRKVDVVKDAFVSTVSHELRTPITSILGYLEVLSDGSLGDLGPRQVDALARVTSNSHRLLSLIDDLLTLSRVAEHGVQVAHTVFDLRLAVREGCAVVVPTLSHPRRLTLETTAPDQPMLVRGDREMVERVLVNLLSNAVKFTPDGGLIRVELAVEEPEVVLRVSDNGIGIPEEEQAELFTRFFRSSLSQGRAIPGSGLGLSITRSIVERHGGSINVHSEVGRGTVVEVRLPDAHGNVQDSTTVDPGDRVDRPAGDSSNR
jgi:PAS domain S-box-containing protein